MKRPLFLLFMIIVCPPGLVHAQQHILTILQGKLKLGDRHYGEGNYRAALLSYEDAIQKDEYDPTIHLRLARCYAHLKDYAMAVNQFEKEKSDANFTVDDFFLFAESLLTVGEHDRAKKIYEKILVRQPDLETVKAKIWRINNLTYLFEDSLHYSLRPISLNTSYSDFGARPHQRGIVFVSNRNRNKPIAKLDAATLESFYHLNFSEFSSDSNALRVDSIWLEEPQPFLKELEHDLHIGPIQFYDNDQKAVLVRASQQPNEDGKRTLQIYFVIHDKNGKWKIDFPFPHNSPNYSLSDPAISRDGKVLYFSSDMKGGYGGKDLYRSELVNNKWTVPKNLGETINTPHDDAYPFFHQNGVLYFSSDGHAGLGGLDVFKTHLQEGGFGEVQNLGYPINSSYDDFSLYLDSLGTKGFLSTNRKNGGFDDDIYEVDVDLQNYPLPLKAVVHVKEHTWSNSSDVKPLGRCRVQLVDNVRHHIVNEVIADDEGNFELSVPYFSYFVLRITASDGEEAVALLDIPKHRTEIGAHEIVVVKDFLKPKQ